MILDYRQGGGEGIEVPTIDEIKQANRAAGQHFFSPSTMRFFRSRVSKTVHGRFFVTSEQFDDHSARLYSVRYASDTGRIKDASGFQAFETSAAAHSAAAELHRAEQVGLITYGYRQQRCTLCDKVAEWQVRRPGEGEGLDICASCLPRYVYDPTLAGITAQ